jgi:hypothetical protein
MAEGTVVTRDCDGEDRTVDGVTSFIAVRQGDYRVVSTVAPKRVRAGR